uniref:Uncharacterized protein n=1 Tax=Monopterus albus TaxID=43700 RepID=A0A3Q3ITH0_MONAL
LPLSAGACGQKRKSHSLSICRTNSTEQDRSTPYLLKCSSSFLLLLLFYTCLYCPFLSTSPPPLSVSLSLFVFLFLSLYPPFKCLRL